MAEGTRIRGRQRKRVAATVAPDVWAEAEALAGWRFGGNASSLLDAALAVAVLVFNDPATHGTADPAEALARYCDAR